MARIRSPGFNVLSEIVSLPFFVKNGMEDGSFERYSVIF
jgi:hypothetical protein